MKPNYLLPIIVFLAMISFLIINQKSNSSVKHITAISDMPIVSGKSESKREEVKERMEQEVLMTKDPQLGFVPSERLIQAQSEASRIMAEFNASRATQTQSLFDWTERGPNNMGGRTRGILIDSADASGNTVFVGSVGGGLWRTTNFKSATPVWTRILSISPNLAITTVAQDPSNFNIMYAGTGEGYFNVDAIRGLGIYKSIDGGLTWNLLASTTTAGSNVLDFGYIQKILVYTNGNIFATAISFQFCNRGGVLKSSDGGVTWSRVIGNWPGGTCAAAVDFKGYDIEMSLGGDLYASVQDGSGSGVNVGKIYKSSAGVNVGNVGTWTDITPAALTGRYWLRIELACAPGNNDRLYALIQGTASAIDTILRSDNGGASWINVDNTTTWCDAGNNGGLDFSRNQAWYDLALAVKRNDDATVFAGGVDIMKTTNSGGTWTQNTQWASGCGLPAVHADIHNIVFFSGSGSTNNELIVVNDGGIYYSNDDGATYSNKSAGYNTIQYYGVAIHPGQGSNYMLAGAQDNGTHKFNNAGMCNVTTVTGGDGGMCFIDQDDPTYQGTSYTGSQYTISRNGGTSFSVSASFTGGRFINPTDYDNTGNYIYCGGASRNLRRIENITSGSPTAFSFAVATNTNFAISALKVDPNIANRVWVAYSTAPGVAGQVPQIYYIDNANNNATFLSTAVNIPAGLAAGSYISSLDVETGDPTHILLTLSNYGVNSVWESTNSGTSWTSIEGNLPDMPVRWGVFVPGGYNPGQRTQAVGGVMLATELGVWSTGTLSAGSTSWIQNSSNLGNVRTDMIKIRNADKLVAVATHGRGVFTTSLFTGVLPVSYINFSGKVEEKHNFLSWKVADEQNNKGFEVERKYKNENTYTKLGFVDAKNNNQLSNEYSFQDKYVDLGIPGVSYRLKQIDFDGKSQYSSIIVLTRKPSVRFIEYISVQDKNLFIRFNSQDEQQVVLKIFDNAGKLLRKYEIKNQTQSVDLSQLKRGIYIIELVRADGERHTQKIIY